MQSRSLKLPGLILITPDVRADSRGFFMETYHARKYHAAGIGCKFVQDNHSRSTQGTIRGMHFQKSPGQDKLVRVVTGTIWDVAVDIRPDSPTFGQYEGVTLDADAHEQLFVPKGFAHGFCVVSKEAEVLYKVSAEYDAAEEDGFAFDDREVGIPWPALNPQVSERDRRARPLSAMRDELRRIASDWQTP